MKTYYADDTFVHSCSAKVKVLLFVAYSIMLFLIHSWWGIAAAFALLLIVVALSKLSVARIGVLLIPVLLPALCTVVVNGFALDVDAAAVRSAGFADVSAGVFASFSPVEIFGQFGWYPAGFAQGCFYAARIILLMAASFVLCFTTAAASLTNALRDFLRPLRRLRVPVDDIATMFSLALRFIPVAAKELERVRNAQLSRAAMLEAGSVSERLNAWKTVLLPTFVGMLHRADTLAFAMSARCYGAPDIQRTVLPAESSSAKSTLALLIGLVAILAIAYAF